MHTERYISQKLHCVSDVVEKKHRLVVEVESAIAYTAIAYTAVEIFCRRRIQDYAAVIDKTRSSANAEEPREHIFS